MSENLIIKLKRHCEHLAELTPQEAGALGPIVQVIFKLLKGDRQIPVSDQGLATKLYSVGSRPKPVVELPVQLSVCGG